MRLRAWLGNGLMDVAGVLGSGIAGNRVVDCIPIVTQGGRIQDGAIRERSENVRSVEGVRRHPNIRPAFRRRSPESAQILADWAALAGPQLAAMAEPLRLSNGTLTLACHGVAAMELTLMAPVLIERLNSQIGRAAVQRLAFVQRAPRLTLPVVRRTPPPPVPAAAQATLATVPEGDLQAALARLAAHVFARPR